MAPCKSLNNHHQKWIYVAIIFILISVTIFPGSSQFVFAQASYPPPITTYPVDGQTITIDDAPPLAIPEFAWEAVDGAEKYRFQLSNDIAFTSIPVNITTPNTRYTPTNINKTILVDGEWYWRVRVESPGTPGDYSQPSLFTKQWAAQNNNPALQSPDEGATLHFYGAPTFSWSRVMGASHYLFQIAATADGFASPLESKETLATSYQPETKRANGIYYWRVVPLDPGGNSGTPSEVRSFTLAYGVDNSDPLNEVPVLVEPENNSQPLFTPTFHWAAVRGVKEYILEYTTDPTCEFATQSTTRVYTPNTTYTPTSPFPNDQNFCWHVRALSGNSTGDWSEVWKFQMKWDIQPDLLTPTNNYITGLYPLFSWTPVPGASRYRIDVDLDGDFGAVWESSETANVFYTLHHYVGTTDTPYYWKVTPIDKNGKAGVSSPVESFQSYYTSTAPILYYPFYYYLPNDPALYQGEEMHPYADFTVPYPIFMWHRVYNPWPVGGIFANAYRLQVDTDPNFTPPLEWEYDTENLSAAPTINDNFTPQVDQDYYWRVCPLIVMGGECVTNPINNQGYWSQVWLTRINPAVGLPPTNGEAPPQLLRPVHGAEIIETTPLLEWWPYEGADYYEVQVSRDANFADPDDVVFSETIPYPSYTHDTSIAQRFYNRFDYGTFYWQVRANVDGVWRDWSTPWRFQIASQSEVKFSRTIGNTENRLQIGQDNPDDMVDDNYELSYLYGAQSVDYWFIGLNATTGATNMTYGIYLDTDHLDGSGASAPPDDRPYTISTIAAHQPEFAIFIDQVGGSFTAGNTYIYPWEGSSWGFPRSLSDISGGEIYYSGGYLELKIPDTAIEMSDIQSSIALMAFSVNTTSNQLMDSSPSDPNVPGSGLLSRFTSYTEHMNIFFPPNHDGGDPGTYPYILPYFFDYPTGANDESPWAGYRLEVHLDPDYSNDLDAIDSNSSDPYFAYPSATFENDLQGDNTYYWRVRPRYIFPEISLEDVVFGVWNKGGGFERKGFIPQNLQTSISFATPTFSWDRVEGAETYDLQWSTDPQFGSFSSINTTQVTYTPQKVLANDDYYWRVRVRRWGGAAGDWSAVESFSVNLSIPTGLTVLDQEDGSLPVNHTPTFCWDHLLAYAPGDPALPVFSAWKYQIQISRDPTFSTIYEDKETEQNCYTPQKGYADDETYYWRVRMITKDTRGNYSDAQVFTKQYPITTLISPPVGGNVAGTPTFVWEPVDGAAAYKLEVSKYPTFDPKIDDVTTVNTRYTPLKTYPSNMKYYWRVAIKDKNNNFGPFNTATIIIGDYYPIFMPIIRRSP